MPGDKVDIEVYAKYYEPVANDPSAFATLMNSIVNGLAVPAGTIIDGAGYALSANNSLPFTNGLNKSGGDPAAPKAYLNWAVFNRDYVMNLGKSGFAQITTDAREDGTDVYHQLLKPLNEIMIDEPGFVYIWLSNENENPVEVYFDDLKVTHTKSLVIQQDSYYPFGLIFNSYQRENSVINKWKFQGQEHIDDLGLNWDSFKWRNHQPDIGRFFNIDPLADKYVYNSPYAFAENRVIDGRELEGLEWVNATGQQIYDPKANGGKGGYTEHATKNDKRLGNSLQGTATGQKQFGTLVNSDHPIATNVNLDTEPVYNNKAKGVLQLGKTDNKTEKDVSLSGGKIVVEGVTVQESSIKINVSSIEKIMNEGGTFSGEDLKGLSFDQILGAVFGHEIDHTTTENATIEAKGGDAEGAAHTVSKKIIQETKENKSKEKDQKKTNE